MQSALYLPLAEAISYDVENVICKEKSEVLSLIDVEDNQLTEDMVNEICSILEGSKAILKPKVREISHDDTTSKGYILNKMEQQMAYLDKDQKQAALSQINGPQRIRGLAGSGKTIILCMKAALIHLRYPEKKILYTFLTKSLYDYIETMIIRSLVMGLCLILTKFKSSIHGVAKMYLAFTILLVKTIMSLL